MNMAKVQENLKPIHIEKTLGDLAGGHKNNFLV